MKKLDPTTVAYMLSSLKRTTLDMYGKNIQVIDYTVIVSRLASYLDFISTKDDAFDLELFLHDCDMEVCTNCGGYVDSFGNGHAAAC